MNVQIEGRVWIAAHGLSLHDAGKNETERSNEGSFIEDLAALAPGRVEPYSLARSAGTIPVILELLTAAPPDDDIADYDAVVDAPLQLGSGLLRVEGDADTGFGATITPGDHRVRVAYANNKTCRYDYADGADHLRLSVWPAPPAPLVVHKPAEEEDDPIREYQGGRSEAELRAWLVEPSISHRCLAVVALCQLGKLDVLATVLESEKHDAVVRVALAAAGFVGAGALPLLSDHFPADADMRLRMVQTLRLVGGKAAKKLAAELVEDIDEDRDGDVASLIRDAREDLASEDGDDGDADEDDDDDGDAPVWRRFEVDEKFWMIKLDGATHSVRFGKIGTTGQEKTKEFDDDDAARKDYDKLVKEKTKKGYEEVDG